MKKTVAFAVAGTMLAVAGLAQAAGRPGEEIYNKTCKVCHEAGIAGSPKFGDKAAWEPRIAKGMDALMASAVTGTAKGMPPKGTCMDCDDAELKGAIEFMVSKAK
ncbi:MAG: hypothetical protein A2286_05370 [Gammaproteobacteria bacterium RIFOXYA12_FULL_61_12]|nr:MAG: hypothetical protein A2514_07465 [Gammaproteobacteria bacterium RIFOXYD12_FULL_61_37]OGT90032.1 MAG: hypothetical protein A2286_05370 [Gammaproteobacteria bacterium RIFOXYA12_FULL_61_12]